MTPYLTETEITEYCSSPGLTMTEVNEASVIIDSYVGRSFGVVTHTESSKLSKKNSEYGKVHKGKLRHFPRVDILAVSAKVPSYFGGLQNVTYETTSLWFDDEEFDYYTFMAPVAGGMGISTANSALFALPLPNTLTVQYTSGYTEIPEEIKIACGQVMDAIKANGGTTTWKSRTDFDMTIVLNDKEDPIMSGGVLRLINLVKLS